jgi:hypothetical protein
MNPAAKKTVHDETIREESEAIRETTQDIIEDAQKKPGDYLKETIVPEGGE